MTQLKREREFYNDMHWFIMHQLKPLRGLRANWDSYGARPPTWDAFYGVEGLISLIPYDTIFPSIHPTPTGNIQLEWINKDWDLEVEVKGYWWYDTIITQISNDVTWEESIEGKLKFHNLERQLLLFLR